MIQLSSSWNDKSFYKLTFRFLRNSTYAMHMVFILYTIYWAFFDVTKFVCYGDEVKPDRTEEKFFFLIFYEVLYFKYIRLIFMWVFQSMVFFTYVH